MSEIENNGKFNGFFSKKLKAGKRRTYFFDVKSTQQGDFFLTITESKKKMNSDQYESHKIFLYKEDFVNFVNSLNEAVDHIKTELMPDFDYLADRSTWNENNESSPTKKAPSPFDADPKYSSETHADKDLTWES